MFKIQRSSNGKSVVFTLSGRIQAAALTELQKLQKGEAVDHNVALDLKDVKLVDRDVVLFLASCEAKGMNLSNCPRYVREWIRKEAVQSEIVNRWRGRLGFRRELRLIDITSE